MSNKLELTWYGKEKEISVEPRILIEDKKSSYSKEGPTSLFNEIKPTFDNLLIHGDNLLALKALEQDFAGKIKCIYIDPPYNTGSAFEHYDDNLEHSTWLSLMKPRLELLRRLLTDDGIIFIQIDDNEFAYLKVLCDEVFNRSNYLNTITVKMKNIAGADVSPFILPMGLVTLPIFNINLIDLTIVLFYMLNINLIDLTIVLFYMLMDSYEICLLFALHYNIQCI